MVVRELERFYTADDLWELSHQPEYADKKLELSDGNLIVIAPTGGLHGGATISITIPVGSHVRANKLGYVTAAETGYKLGVSPYGRKSSNS